MGKVLPADPILGPNGLMDPMVILGPDGFLIKRSGIFQAVGDSFPRAVHTGVEISADPNHRQDKRKLHMPSSLQMLLRTIWGSMSLPCPSRRGQRDASQKKEPLKGLSARDVFPGRTGGQGSPRGGFFFVRGAAQG